MGVTAVTLGSFYTTSSGKTLLGGAGGSGLDTQSLIKSLTDAKSIGATQDQAQIKTNDSKSSAFTQLQTLLSTFQTAADALRNPPGVNNAASDAFKLTTANVGNGGSNYIGVLAQPGAALQSYNISDISSVASAATQGTGTFAIASANADATVGAVKFNAGTITFAGGATVTVANGDSLATIAANFNAVSSSTGINASIIQVDSTHYQLSFVSTKTGTNANFDLTGAPTVTGGGAVLANIGLGAAASGTNAIFKVNNVQITRQSNNVDDVLSGVTFKIFQTTPDAVTNYSVNVIPDATTIQNSIVNFTTAYNAIKTFESQQTQLGADGTYATNAVLVNDPTFQAVLSDVNRTVNTQVLGITGTDPASLSDVGITFTKQAATSTAPEVDNILTVDDTKLASALTTNFNGVRNLFQFNLTSSNPNIAIYSHSLPIGITDFSVNIVTGANTFTATYTQNGSPVTTNLTAQVFTNGTPGYTLVGAAGSPLEGATFIYGSNADATFNVHLTQGIADQVYTSASSALTDKTGSLAVALKGLKDSDTKLNDDIKNINAQVTIYQDQLQQKFAALEKAISSANTLLQSLNANSNAQLTSSGH